MGHDKTSFMDDAPSVLVLAQVEVPRPARRQSSFARVAGLRGQGWWSGGTRSQAQFSALYSTNAHALSIDIQYNLSVNAVQSPIARLPEHARASPPQNQPAPATMRAGANITELFWPIELRAARLLSLPRRDLPLRPPLPSLPFARSRTPCTCIADSAVRSYLRAKQLRCTNVRWHTHGPICNSLVPMLVTRCK